jgi:hypothetical protein
VRPPAVCISRRIYQGKCASKERTTRASPVYSDAQVAGLVPQACQDRVSIPSLASLKPQAWRSMWACALMPSLAATAARAIMGTKPTADSCAPCADAKTGRTDFSLWCRCSPRNSRPVSGCVLGVPPLTRRLEVDLLPAHIRQLGRPQVTISHEDHQRIVACDLSARH